MTPAVWKGLLRFGLLTIPVKLYRAAQAEKISFRQVHKQTGASVRHSLCTDSDRLDALSAQPGSYLPDHALERAGALDSGGASASASDADWGGPDHRVRVARDRDDGRLGWTKEEVPGAYGRGPELMSQRVSG